VHVLEGIDGVIRGRVIVVSGAGLSVGKRADNDLVLDDPHVSRQHARFLPQSGALAITDLGSTNGTYVNKLQIQTQTLKSGDRIEIGGCVLRYRDRPVAQLHDGASDDASPQVSVIRSVVAGQGDASFGAAALRTAPAARADPQLSAVAEALTELARTRPGSLAPEEMLARILELVFQFSRADRGCILLLDAQGQPSARVVRNRDARRPDEDLPLSRTLVRRAMETREALLIPDAASDPGLARVSSVMMHALRCVAYVPLCFADETLGVLCVDTPVPGGLGETDLDGLVAFANHAALIAYQVSLQEAVEREVERRNRLQRFLGRAVAERFILEGVEPELGGEERQITVLFADLRGYTGLTEQMAPPEALALLNTLFEGLCAPILRQGGTLDKYIGDCVMALFNAPVDDAHHCLRAVQAAVDMQSAMVQLKASLAEKYAGLEIGIAINTGRAVVGNIGTDQKMDYTAIGDAVNVAARLEDIAEGRQILVTEAVAARVQPFMELEQVTTIQLRGRQQETRVFAVTGVRETAAAAAPAS